jgi:hypothetical protein
LFLIKQLINENVNVAPGVGEGGNVFTFAEVYVALDAVFNNWKLIVADAGGSAASNLHVADRTM